MFSTCWPCWGGTRTKALASSIVLRTKLKLFAETWVGGGEVDERLNSEEVESHGDVERPENSVHEDVADEMETWRARCHFVRSSGAACYL